MFDRVFICPQCGEADGFAVFSPWSQTSDYGVRFRIQCVACARIVREVVMDWTWSHRFLRRSFNELRIGRNVYRPCLWRPVADSHDLGKSEFDALRLQVIECMRICQPHLSGWLYPEVGVPADIEALLSLALQTTVNTDDKAFTLRDFLSHCIARHFDRCFG